MQKNDGRWWLLAPEVHGLFGIGLSHPLNKKPISWLHRHHQAGITLQN